MHRSDAADATATFCRMVLVLWSLYVLPSVGLSLSSCLCFLLSVTYVRGADKGTDKGKGKGKGRDRSRSRAVPPGVAAPVAGVVPAAAAAPTTPPVIAADRFVARELVDAQAD